MSQNIVLRVGLFFSLALIVLVGCIQGVNPTETPYQVIEETPQINTPNPTSTISPTIQISPSVTHTFIPTITPLPTLAADVAKKTIVTAIQPQEQCALPCFFAITPGDSDFEDVYNHFSQFSEIGHIGLSSNRLSSSDWFSLRVNFSTYALVTQVYRASGGKVAYFTAGAQISKIKDEKRVFDDPAYVEMWHDYFLPEILTKYGKPGEIFLDTTRLSGDPSNVFPFVIWVVYPDQGFLIRYEGNNIKVEDDIRICPLQSDVYMISWRTETSTYERFIEGDMAMGTSLGPQPLEDVTDFDITSFYDQFKDAKFSTCFDTPASLWP